MVHKTAARKESTDTKDVSGPAQQTLAATLLNLTWQLAIVIVVQSGWVTFDNRYGTTPVLDTSWRCSGHAPSHNIHIHCVQGTAGGSNKMNPLFAAAEGPAVHIAPSPVFHVGGVAITNSMLYGWIATALFGGLLLIWVARQVSVRP